MPCARKLETQAVHQYNIKLAGRTPDIADQFRYMPPRMRRVVKENGRVPADYEKRTRPLDEAGFHGLVHERKRVFVLAGAGVGKTTFLYRLQLELLRGAAGESPVPVFENVAGFFGQSGTLLDRTSGMLKEMRVVDFSRRKADKVAGVLSENGRLCYLLDALDQCPADGRCKGPFSDAPARAVRRKPGGGDVPPGSTWMRIRTSFATPFRPSSG